MVRHIFIGTFKDGVSDEMKKKELANLREIKEIFADYTAAQFEF